jgi:ketosteroid isomerase-like protein
MLASVARHVSRKDHTVKKTPFVLLALAAAFAAACGPKVNDPADVQAIKDTGPAYDKFANAGDAAGLASEFYAPDAIRMDPNQPASAGTAAIRASLEKSYAHSTSNVRDVIDDVRALGGFAVAKGTYEGTSTPKAGGAAAPEKGKFVTLYERQANGSWKAVWDIYNSDLPAAGATADGADEQALLQLERDWAVASAAGDVAGLDKILAAEYAGNTDGQITPKKQSLANVKSGVSKTTSAEPGELKAFVVGDTATVHGVWTEKSSLSGKDTSGTYRFIDSFVKRDGRWQAVATFSTKIQ